MKNVVKIIYILLSAAFLYYLALPNIDYPPKLEPSIQSFEPADVESTDRRGYYTDMDRGLIMNYYLNNYRLAWNSVNAVRLNYPPEEAQTLIRDQARSTFLEEIVYPFRESLFVNGFKPDKDKDAILIDSKPWLEKIIAKRVTSTLLARLLIGTLTIVVIGFVYSFYGQDLKALNMAYKQIKKNI